MLNLEADDEHTMYWYVDAFFAVPADMKIHTGYLFYLGKGMIVAASTEQKVNARISTDLELIGVDDRISKILWTRIFGNAWGLK